jgi:NodT family efflux transporter outer membrane factor (OMF) lipoprotein
MMMKIVTACVVVLMLAGCSIGGDYRRPETPSPAGWQGQAAAAWPSLDWWRGFKSPRLDELMEQAEATNYDIAAAVARVRQADAQVKIAGAPLLPSVSAQSGDQRTRSVNTIPKTGITPVGQKTYDAILTASYEIDFWGKNADALQAAQASAQASRFNQQTTALAVQSGVANTYFAVLSLSDRLAVARNNLAAAEKILDAFRARAAVGTAADLDIAQQESVVAEQRATLAPLTQQLRQNVNALAILVGRLPEDVQTPSGTLDNLSLPLVGPGLPSDLLTRRPDVQMAEAQLVAANASLKQAKAQVFPSISLTAQGGAESRALNAILDPASTLYLLAVSATQPIFEGGVLEGGIELQQARYDELLQDYRKAVISAFSDVETALAAVELTGEQTAAQQAAVDTAQRAYDIAQAQLFSGTIDILTVLNTQRTLFQAQDLLVQAKLAQAQAVVSLFMALGGGWQT